MASPYSLGGQVYTWAFFLLVFSIALLMGFASVWVDVSLSITPRSSDSRLPFAVQLEPITAWIFSLYAYAYTYARVIFASLFACCVIILMRLMLATMREDARAGVAWMATIFDANTLLDFMHYVHWPYHCCALGIYMIVSFVTIHGLLDTPSEYGDIGQDAVMTRYTRVTILTSGVVLLFYTLYAARCIYTAKLYGASS